jgi:tetratricopeptide (TPR) repeat protein
MISGLSSLNMNNKMKHAGILLGVTIASALLFGQLGMAQKGVEDGSKYGHGQDSIECMRNLSLYREYVKQNDYQTALPFWRKAFNGCPQSFKSIYLDGVKMYRDFIEKEKDPLVQSKLVDTLMLIYETRIRYFNQKDEVRARQGIDLLRYKRDDLKEVQRAYGHLKESVDLAGDESSEAAIATFMSASMSLFQNQKLPAGDLIADFLSATEILNTKIANSPADTMLIPLQENLTRNFVQMPGIRNEDLLSSIDVLFKEKPNDPKLLKVIVAVLEAKKLTEEPLWSSAAKNLFSQYPSADLASKIAYISHKKNDSKEASNYFNQAIQLETDNSKKADYYYGLAASTDNLGNKSLARDYAQKAIDLKSDWGEPYILIAQLYTSSRDLCQGISLPNAIYWVAVDKLNKAKQVDPSVETEANNLILNLSPHFPNKEEAFFLNIMEGDTYYVGCWINENTKARF